MSIDVRWGAATHQGRVRKQNEDSVLAGPVVFAVADGMGGHAGGEVASAIAIAMLAVVEPSSIGPDSVRTVLENANEEILRRARSGEGPDGMGTTVSGFGVAEDSSVTLFNLGDSRVYRWRDGVLEQLTDDDSLVGEMVRRGELTVLEAASHRDRNVITRALGIEPAIEPMVRSVDVRGGDRLMVCSDGLSNELDEEALAGLLATSDAAEPLAQTLLEAALATGGRDNISVVLVDIVGTDAETDLDADTNPHPVLAAATEEVTDRRPMITAVPPSLDPGEGSASR